MRKAKASHHNLGRQHHRTDHCPVNELSGSTQSHSPYFFFNDEEDTSEEESSLTESVVLLA